MNLIFPPKKNGDPMNQGKLGVKLRSRTEMRCVSSEVLTVRTRVELCSSVLSMFFTGVF